MSETQEPKLCPFVIAQVGPNLQRVHCMGASCAIYNNDTKACSLAAGTQVNINDSTD